MIFIDFSQIVIAAAKEYFERTKIQIDLNLLRHIALTNILLHKKKLQRYIRNDKDVYLCFDGRHYWRRTEFQYYKQNRVKDKQESKFDWDAFFIHFNTLKTEFKEYIPFHCIELEGAEADDIIATLSIHFCDPNMKNVIVSSDKDFLQIQLNICRNIDQFSPWHKKFLTPEETGYDFFSHIIKGDKGDGIPNIFSDDDVYMNEKKRSTPIRESNINKWRDLTPEEFCPDMDSLKKLKRNQLLIDLLNIPEDISTGILDQIKESDPTSSKFFDYLSSNRLTQIMERSS